jgi:hypothetical protein
MQNDEKGSTRRLGCREGRRPGYRHLEPKGLHAALFDLSPEQFIEMLHDQANDLRNPPVSFNKLFDRLARLVPDLVMAVREHLENRR